MNTLEETPPIETERKLTPELLDELPPADRRAVQSRKDLQRINRIMGHAGFLAEAWRRNQPDRWISTIVDLGAGDGTFLLDFARQIAPVSRPFNVLLLDRLNAVQRSTLDGFENLGWQADLLNADVFEWLSTCKINDAAVISNLFLHHFDNGRLSGLLEQISACASLFIALEPRRCFGSRIASRLLGLIGCNSVTRHDAVASVQAGFKGRELSALWPQRGWYVHETGAGRFTHCFTAQRFSTPPRK